MAIGYAATRSGLFKSLRLQSTEISTAVTWGVATTAGALWLVQPFDWLKKQLFEKPQPEQ